MRHKKIVVDTHHRRSRHQKGTNDPENLVKVLKTHHVAFHTLFWTGEPHQVAKILNETYIDPAYELIVVPRKKADAFAGEGIA
jgi:hypothetical protein